MIEFPLQMNTMTATKLTHLNETLDSRSLQGKFLNSSDSHLIGDNTTPSHSEQDTTACIKITEHKTQT